MRRSGIRLAGLAITLALAGFGSSGCTTARNILGTRISPCFRVLPEAGQAVQLGNSRVKAPPILGVQWLATSDLVKAVELTRGTPPPASLAAVGHQATCAVAFRGRFHPGDVLAPWTPGPGPYKVAIVVVRQSDAHVISTVLLRRTPKSLHFSRGFAFIR